jgi:hypothetical protein
VTIRRLKRKIIKFFFREQWSLLVCGLDGAILTHIVPPKNYIWADPFPVETDNKTYIFLEQQIGYNNGTLGYIELYPDLTHSDFIQILAKDYHLSFPHVFCMEQNDERVWYMVPESHENGTIDLYKADRFPCEWRYEMTLMNNVSAVDTAIFYYNKTWWLFTSIASESMPMNQSFSAFYSDSFPSNTWTPHPQNPLCVDAGNSRMAGTIFRDKGTGKLYRPAQSCIKEYGERMHINEIDTLELTSYKEKNVKTIFPERGLYAIGTHTINYSDTYMLRDIKTRRLRII